MAYHDQDTGTQTQNPMTPTEGDRDTETQIDGTLRNPEDDTLGGSPEMPDGPILPGNPDYPEPERRPIEEQDPEQGPTRPIEEPNPPF